MTFLGWRTGRNTRNAWSAIASRRDRARFRLAAEALEQCEDRVLLASILGTAQSFAILGASTVTSTGATAIVGNVGVSPGSAITGFPPGVVTGGTIHANDAVASQAHSDLVTAYGIIAGEAPAFADLVRSYERAAIITAHSALKDFHLAQDAAQEAFVIAYQRLG